MKKYVCLDCGWIYDEMLGLPELNIAAGTRWEELPDNFKCPECDTLKNQSEMWQVID